VSIQHVVVHKPCRLRSARQCNANGTNDTAGCEDHDETKVFAISSEGGNVMYHVSPSNTSTFSRGAADELQTYAALMSMSDQCSTQTVHTLYNDSVAVTEMNFDRVRLTDVNLLVNPFGSIVAVGNEFEEKFGAFAGENKMNCLTRTACQQEGILFDDGQYAEQSDSGSVDLLVKQILDEMIDNVLNGDQRETSSTPINWSQSTESTVFKDSNSDGVEQQPMATNNRPSEERPKNGFAKDLPVTSSPIIHPLHVHILLYTHKFDTRRAIYAFDRLMAVLQSSPRLVVRALTTSNVGGTGTPRSVLLQTLLAQHRHSVLGHRFYGDDVESTSATAGIRSSMFVEVLLMVSLYYLRAHFPNLLAASLERSDLSDNSQLQIMSVDTLVTILGELGNIARTGGRGFATYIVDLLDKCKVTETYTLKQLTCELDDLWRTTLIKLPSAAALQ
jgi:hypothetical protein